MHPTENLCKRASRNLKRHWEKYGKQLRFNGLENIAWMRCYWEHFQAHFRKLERVFALKNYYANALPLRTSPGVFRESWMRTKYNIRWTFDMIRWIREYCLNPLPLLLRTSSSTFRNSWMRNKLNTETWMSTEFDLQRSSTAKIVFAQHRFWNLCLRRSFNRLWSIEALEARR